MPFVYFIKSERSKWVYVGSTENLEKRISQHNSGEVTATKYRRPYSLIHFEKYDNIQDARRREKKIKRTRSLKEEIVKKALSSNG